MAAEEKKGFQGRGECERSFDGLLDTLGRVDGEYTAVCHKSTGSLFSSSVVDSVNASALISSLPHCADVWFSANPTAGPARRDQGCGNQRQVTRWAALYQDVDVKDGALSDLNKAAGFIGALSAMIGTRPSAVIYSAHNLQPLWPVEDGDLDTDEKWCRAYRLVRRFGRLANRVARDFAANLDHVSDLSGVLRVPDTTNWKDRTNPAPVYARPDSGGPLTVDRVEEFLDEWAPQIGGYSGVDSASTKRRADWKQDVRQLDLGGFHTAGGY